ncbi:MAG TPA: DUF1365 domain-containing protein [Kofleriaceae bacterium]|nr:DUF1365 domain-containing protein [Kofleriaceae bacterium]
MTRSVLYRGQLVHVRSDEHARRFRYPVFVAGVELDELPALDRARRLFAYNRASLFSLRDRDYVDRGAVTSIADWHRAQLARRGLPVPARVELVTWLRTAGYVFNPVSFFVGRDTHGAIASVVALVRNNYGGRHTYVLGPDERRDDERRDDERRDDRDRATTCATFRVDKAFFVSPFLHGPATYDFRFGTRRDRLDIHMDVRRPDGARVLMAHLGGAPTPFTDRALAAAALRYPLMSLQVIALIYGEALLAHARGVPFRRPGRDHAVTDAPPPSASHKERGSERSEERGSARDAAAEPVRGRAGARTRQ